MKKNSFRLLGTILATVLLMTGLVTCVHCAAASNVSDSPDYALIDSFIQSQMEDCRIPGFSLGIIRDGSVLYLKGYGKADETGRGITPQTPFLIGSVSKTFTALAVMQLVDAGKVALDQTVKTYLPSFELADSDVAAKITVRQLLNHTSGIPPESEYRAATLRGDDETISELVDKFGTIRPVSAPGTRFAYGNANYIILGELVQQVSGLSYEEYIQKYIFDPLEMHHSYTSAKEAMQNGLAAGYRPIFGIPQISGLPYRQDFLPAYSIISCAEDMTHYMIAMQQGGRYKGAQVLSSESIHQMTAASVSISRWESYGLGWYVTSGSIYHGGELPDYQAKVKLLPEAGLGIVLIYNTSSSTLGTLLNVGYRDRIETGIINVLYNADPMDQPGKNPLNLNSYPASLSYGLLQAFAGVTVMLVALCGWKLRTLKKRLEKSRAAFLRIMLTTVLIHIVAPLILLLGIPSGGGNSWAHVLFYIPGAGWFALFLSLTLLAIGLIKGFIIIKLWGKMIRRTDRAA
jgi:CubicO group peptidase (beta-lactamase class C family)